MNSPEILKSFDRCERSAFYGIEWQRDRIRPSEALLKSVVAGISDEETLDCGQSAGDELMTIASERGLDMESSILYRSAVHLAGLADILAYSLRGRGAPWRAVEDKVIDSIVWESGAFLDPSRAKLHRVVIVDRWSEERQMAEIHSWATMGEVCIYELPMTLHVLVAGQMRDGRRSSPWTKGFIHPVTHDLRFKKRSGAGFDSRFDPIWREESSDYDRDEWLRAMEDDGVLMESTFTVDVGIPSTGLVKQWRDLAVKNLGRIKAFHFLPDPAPSQCFWPSPCQFCECCVSGRRPSAGNGFTGC